MEISTFFRNDDLSFGFDGFNGYRNPADDYKFGSPMLYGFTDDADYNYATGRAAQVAQWHPITDVQKNDCEVLSKLIEDLERVVKDQEDAVSAAKGRDKRVKQEYLNAYRSRLSEFKGYYSKANCEIVKAEKAEEKFQSQLSSILSSDKGDNKAAQYALVIGGVAVLGVLGYFVYKKYKK